MRSERRLTYRSATPSDARAIAHVHVLSWQAAYRGLLPDELLDGLSVAQQEKMWVSTLAAAANQTWLAVWDDEVVGFCTADQSRDPDCDPARVGEVIALYLVPQVWHRGAGHELFRRAAEELRTSGLTAVTAWVLAENSRAIAFYERQGMARDGAARGNARLGKEVVRLRKGLGMAAAEAAEGLSTNRIARVPQDLETFEV